MTKVYEESVSESEETRMARLHSLLTKHKNRSSDSSPPPVKRNPRRIRIALKDSQRTVDGEYRTRVVLDNTPPSTPSRTHHAVKPSPYLQRAEWRANAMLQYHQQAIEIRQKQLDAKVDVFPFFALPAELRMAVYFELLVTDDRLLPTWRGPRKATKQQKKMHIDILLTCKMCRDEGVQVLYGENIFDFGEICNRPNNFSKPFVKHIGLHNASLIRIIFAEYSAAAEELSYRHLNTPPTLTSTYLRTFLSTFSISLPSLRLLAISIMPYGHDQATDILLQRADSTLWGNMPIRLQWLDAKNEPKRLGKLIDGICEREPALARADYWRDVDGWIGIHFAPPSAGREWVVYTGVRGKGEGEEQKEEGEEQKGEREKHKGEGGEQEEKGEEQKEEGERVEGD